MSTSQSKILEKIRAAEAEIARLVPLRKEEIYNVLKESGGISLDNKLLAGFARYVSDPANKDSTFLRELSELGRTIYPSKRNKKSSASIGTKTSS